MRTVTKTHTSAEFSATLVEAVGTTWEAIREQHPDVPDVVITVGPGAERGGLRLGHFAAGAWQAGDALASELFIGGEGLAKGPRDLLVTLLHEAAHGIAHAREIKDTSRQGRYHNSRFRELAGEVGLTVTKDAKLGWSASQLAEGTDVTYAAQITALGAVLTAHRRQFGNAAGDTKKSNNGVAARCGCGRKIRVSRSTYDAGPILCGLCEDPFTAEDEDSKPEE